ncbi:MFS transporter, partial [Paenibacillus riograndensis]
MATLLLVVIYIIFISLGIPDSLFGAAWPAIYDEFSLPVSAAGSVTFTISACTTISSLLSARLINKYGTAKLTTISVFLTATALLGFSLSPNIIWFCLFALPLGLGAGAVDAALNNYVALYYKASHMNLLHCFYGLGVSVSPYIMSLALSQQNNWRGGYSNAFWIQ